MICKSCGVNAVIAVNSFRPDNKHKRYYQCTNCKDKSKEINISFAEILDNIKLKNK